VNKNLEHYFFHRENFLDKDCCDDYVNELSSVNWEKHVWYTARSDDLSSPSGDDEPEYFGYDLFTDKVRKINDDIIQKLHPVILEYIESFDFDWFFSWEGYSGIKFIRYHPNQTMKNHWDQIQSLFDGERKGVPILSIIGILNDDYEGGDLVMFEDKKIYTKKGDLIIFPSNFLFPHQISPVIKGIRYSYVSWTW
jgi:hypothetical protein